MRKLAIVALLVFSLTTVGFGLAQAQTPGAQGEEAAPISTEVDGSTSDEVPDGASLEVLAESTSANGDVGMTLYRITMEPGVAVDPHWHSGSVTWVVDSGTLGFTVTDGAVWVRCADCVPDGSPDESGYTLVPVGTEILLEPGDWIIQHDTTEHAYRNAGDDPVVIDASTSYALEQAAPQADGGATPAAAPIRIKPQGCRGGCM